MLRPLPRRPLVVPPLRLSLPLRPFRVLRMYAGCPCPHAIQLPEVAASAPRRRQVLSLLHQRAVLWPRGHSKRSRGVGSCVRELARKSYKSLTVRTTVHPSRDSLRLMAHSRRANAKIPLVCFPHHLLSRVLGRPYLAHATVAQLPSRESAALSTPALVPGMKAQVNGSEGALSNPESHTFGLPVVGGAGSLLPRRAGVRAHTLESDPGWSSISVSLSSSAAAAMSARARSARGQVASPEPRSSGSPVRSSSSLSSEGECQGTQLHSAHSFGSQGSRQQQYQEEETPPLPSILSQSVQSEDTTSGRQQHRQ
jgi:hypothetical protein